MRTAFLALIAASSLLVAPSVAPAAIIFDNLAGSGGTTGGPSYTTGPNQGIGAILNFSASTRISSFEVYTATVNPQQAVFRFVIVDLQTSNTVLTTAFRAFLNDGATDPAFKSSGALDFTFLTGRDYAIGYVANFASTSPTIPGLYSQNGISQAGNSALFNAPQFQNPAYVGPLPGGAVVRLINDFPSPAVPEPSSFLLVGLAGSIGLVVARARR